MRRAARYCVMSARASGTVELVVERDRFAPGDAIRGSVTPRPHVCGGRPRARRVLAHRHARVHRRERRAALGRHVRARPCPPTRRRASRAAPARSSGGCARARASTRSRGDARRTLEIDMPVLTEAERHALAMRLVGDFEARRFHVELSTAELGGGGTIAGRVHRDRELAAGPIVVRARCMRGLARGAAARPDRAGQPLDAHAALARAHAVVGGAGAGRPRRRPLGGLRVHPAARPAARSRGALGRLALRDRGAAPAAPAPGRARARRAARASARCCSSPGCRCRCASRERAASTRRPRSASTAPRTPTSAGAPTIPRPAIEAILAERRAAPGRTLLELGAGTGKLTRAARRAAARA